MAHDEAFCDADLPMVSGTTGSMTLAATGDYLPLCDGWIIIADTDRDRIAVRNVVAARDGAFFNLPSKPGDLALDEEEKLLYVALPDQLSLGVLDLITGNLTVILMGTQLLAIAVGPDGGVFTVGSDSYDTALHWLPPDSEVPVGPWRIHGNLIRYNAASDELVVADSSYSVRRYSFDPMTGPTQLQQAFSGNGADLAVSPDGRHIAVASGGGNGQGYTIFDFDASDLSVVRGEWPVGAYPSGVAFNPTSERVVATNRDDIVVYDVTTFEELASHQPTSCPYGDVRRVTFSRGSEIVFGQQTCGFRDDSSRIHWFVP